MMRRLMPITEAVEFLRRPEAYSDRPHRVETLETHFAWIFLSARSAYKLKKPIRFGLVDFREREARRAYCELEVGLNRRLAEGTYLRVVPLTRTTGGLAIGGAGEIVDWLVEMRRLHRARTLAAVAQHGVPTDEELVRVVRKLTAFYARTPLAPWGGNEYLHALRQFSAQQAGLLRDAAEHEAWLDLGALERLAVQQVDFIDRNDAMLRQRVAQRRVVDAHGDLRAEHVFLEDPCQIIDCLEFSIELRWLDAAEEVSFLALDCERLGMPVFGERLLELYQQIAGDTVSPALLDFYRSRRALARAVLCASRIAEATSDADAWRARARWYFRAAEGGNGAGGGKEGVAEEGVAEEGVRALFPSEKGL
jgi:uncharacterized protein